MNGVCKFMYHYIFCMVLIYLVSQNIFFGTGRHGQFAIPAEAPCTDVPV